MKITKISLKLLKKHGRMLDKNREPRKKYESRISLIAEILLQSEIICGNAIEGFEIYDKENLALYYTNTTWEKRCLAGISTRYPSCISCRFTHGLNEVELIDPDKLIRNIAA